MAGFEKALGAVKVIKDQIQYRSQSLLNLARGYFISCINEDVQYKLGYAIQVIVQRIRVKIALNVVKASKLAQMKLVT